MPIPAEPEELYALVSQGELNNNQAIEILNQHNHDRFDCEACEYIDDEEFDSIIGALTQNPNYQLGQEAINLCLAILEEHWDWSFNAGAGQAQRLAVDLSLLPASNGEALKSGAIHYGFCEEVQVSDEGEPYSEEDFVSTLERVARHPKATEEIFKDWLSYAHEPRHGEGISGDCVQCQTHLTSLWSA